MHFTVFGAGLALGLGSLGMETTFGALGGPLALTRLVFEVLAFQGLLVALVGAAAEPKPGEAVLRRQLEGMT